MNRILALIVIFAIATMSVAIASCGGQAPPVSSSVGPQITFQSPSTPAQEHFVSGKFGNDGNARSEASPTVGETLTTTNGAWTNNPTNYAYDWQDCNSSGTGCVNIPGASTTSGQYVIQSSDVGDTIRVSVVAINGAGSSIPAFSAITGIVSGSSGFTGSCNVTITPSTTSGAVATAEHSLSAGQVLCLSGGTYGTVTTPSGCVESGNINCSGANANVFTKSGTVGNDIIVTSAPGATATVQGSIEVDASNITLEYMNLDVSNGIGGGTCCANPNPPCLNAPKNQALSIGENPSTNVTIQDDNIYQSVVVTRAIDIFVSNAGSSSGLIIEHNNISHGGSCDQTQHLIYDDGGTNGLITQNWFYTDQYGYGVQMYPGPGTTTVSSNVIDGTLDGFVDDSSVGGNTITHNVVINPITANAINSGNSQSFGGGAFQSCFHDQSGATDFQTNNAIYNASAGFGCSSETGVTITGQLTLPANPFVNGTTTPGSGSYNLCPTVQTGCTSSQVTAAGELSSYNLWNGVGPPTPDPGKSLAAEKAGTGNPDTTVIHLPTTVFGSKSGADKAEPPN